MGIPATINSDLGEGFANYSFGNDPPLFKIIHLANVACGFHGGDPDVLDTTIKTAKENNVRVGAHPSLPDKQGFGRREMKMDPQEFENCMLYQVGAITGFLKKYNVPLHHIKPHGSSYGMTSRDMELAKTVARVAKMYGVAILGLAGTYHEKAAAEVGVDFIPEWFADLEYSPEGKLLIARKHQPPPLEEISKRAKHVLKTGEITTNSGTTLPIFSNQTIKKEISICIHSDNPTCIDIAKTVEKALLESQ